MKKLIILFVIVSSGFLCQPASAQLQFRINIGSQPMWGPVGYDRVDNYYLPDLEAYYNVSSCNYTYQVDGRWITRAYLPTRFRGVDMYNTRKVVINGSRPYLRHNEYKVKYAQYQERSDRGSIRDSRDGKYFESRYHPQHDQYREYTRQHGRYRGENNGRGNER